MQWNKFKAREGLEALIRGKETREEVLDSTKKGVASVATVKFYIPSNSFTKDNPGFLGEQTLEVHADTDIQSIVLFLSAVTDETICLAKGTKNGIRIGIGGQPIEKLNIFRAKKR